MSNKIQDLKKYIQEIKSMPITSSFDEEYVDQFGEPNLEISNIKDTSDLLSDYSGFMLRENLEEIDVDGIPNQRNNNRNLNSGKSSNTNLNSKNIPDSFPNNHDQVSPISNFDQMNSQSIDTMYEIHKKYSDHEMLNQKPNENMNFNKVDQDVEFMEIKRKESLNLESNEKISNQEMPEANAQNNFDEFKNQSEDTQETNQILAHPMSPQNKIKKITSEFSEKEPEINNNKPTELVNPPQAPISKIKAPQPSKKTLIPKPRIKKPKSRQPFVKPPIFLPSNIKNSELEEEKNHCDTPLKKSLNPEVFEEKKIELENYSQTPVLDSNNMNEKINFIETQNLQIGFNALDRDIKLNNEECQKNIPKLTEVAEDFSELLNFLKNEKKNFKSNLNHENNAQEEVKLLQAKISEQENTISQMNEKLNSNENIISSLNIKTKLKENELNDLKVEINDLNNEISQKNSLIENLNYQNESKDSKINSILKSVEEMKNNFEQKISELKNQISTEKKEIDISNKQLQNEMMNIITKKVNESYLSVGSNDNDKKMSLILDKLSKTLKIESKQKNPSIENNLIEKIIDNSQVQKPKENLNCSPLLNKSPNLNTIEKEKNSLLSKENKIIEKKKKILEQDPNVLAFEETRKQIQNNFWKNQTNDKKIDNNLDVMSVSQKKYDNPWEESFGDNNSIKSEIHIKKKELITSNKEFLKPKKNTNKDFDDVYVEVKTVPKNINNPMIGSNNIPQSNPFASITNDKTDNSNIMYPNNMVPSPSIMKNTTEILNESMKSSKSKIFKKNMLLKKKKNQIVKKSISKRIPDNLF